MKIERVDLLGDKETKRASKYHYYVSNVSL
jgi:hypothetical protein